MTRAGQAAMDDQMFAPDLDAGTLRCSQHDRWPAEARCADCDRLLCADCHLEIASSDLCQPCAFRRAGIRH